MREQLFQGQIFFDLAGVMEDIHQMLPSFVELNHQLQLQGAVVLDEAKKRKKNLRFIYKK
jgi:hypothetical protein